MIQVEKKVFILHIASYKIWTVSSRAHQRVLERLSPKDLQRKGMISTAVPGMRKRSPPCRKSSASGIPPSLFEPGPSTWPKKKEPGDSANGCYRPVLK